MALAETARLIASLELDSSKFQSGLRSAEGSIGKMESRFGRVGSIANRGMRTLGSNIKSIITSPLGMLGLAGGIYGVERAIQGTITAASDFHQQMELITTQAGAAQSEVNDLSTKVLDMAKATGTGPEQLAMGLFHVESAGFRGAKALDILRIAAEGAKVGNADLETVTNALVGAEQSGIQGAESYAGAMGTLNAIVGAGNMRMEDLVASFGSGILASARTFGISLKSVGAALATMSDEGIPAVDAATRLRMSFSLMGAPTAKAIGLLKDIGIGQFDLAKKMRSPDGFVSAIGLLREHMVKAGLIGPDGNPNPQGAALLSRAFGGGRSSAAIMTLLSNFSLLQQKQDAVNKGAGDFDAAWAKTQQTSAFHFAQFGAVLDKLKVKIGDKLLPVVTDALGGLSDWLDSHGDDIATMFEGGAKFAGQLGGVIKDDILPVFGAIASAWGKLPSGLQQLLVGGFVVNKLTGGMVTGIAGELFKGITGKGLGGGLGGALGGKAGVVPVFVTNMGAGGLGGGVAPAAGATGGLGLLTGGLALIGVAGIELTIADVLGKAIRGAVEPGNTGPLKQDHVIAQLGPLEIGVFKSQAQAAHEAAVAAKDAVQTLSGSPDDRDERHRDAVAAAKTLDAAQAHLSTKIEDLGATIAKWKPSAKIQVEDRRLQGLNKMSPDERDEARRLNKDTVTAINNAMIDAKIRSAVIADQLDKTQSTFSNRLDGTNNALDTIRSKIAVDDAVTVGATRSGSSQIVSAIERNGKPVVNVTVNVSPSGTASVYTSNGTASTGRTGSGARRR